MNRCIAMATLALLLSACADKPSEPVVNTVTADVPTPVSCVPDTVTAAPTYPDTLDALKSAAELADFEKLLDSGARLRAKRLDLLETVVAKCRDVKPTAVAK
jgi:hypothetical protein